MRRRQQQMWAGGDLSNDDPRRQECCPRCAPPPDVYKQCSRRGARADAWQCMWASRPTATILRVFILVPGNQRGREGENDGRQEGRGREGGREGGEGGREGGRLPGKEGGKDLPPPLHASADAGAAIRDVGIRRPKHVVARPQAPRVRAAPVDLDRSAPDVLVALPLALDLRQLVADLRVRRRPRPPGAPIEEEGVGRQLPERARAIPAAAVAVIDGPAEGALEEVALPPAVRRAAAAAVDLQPAARGVELARCLAHGQGDGLADVRP